jgi:hypothetical protein
VKPGSLLLSASSALTPQGAAELDDFAAGYEQEISARAVAIETALADERASRLSRSNSSNAW